MRLAHFPCLLFISYRIFVDTRHSEQVVSQLRSIKGVLADEDVRHRSVGR